MTTRPTVASIRRVAAITAALGIFAVVTMHTCGWLALPAPGFWLVALAGAVMLAVI